MAASSCALRFCLRFTYLLVICIVFDGKGCSLETIHSNHTWNRAVEYNIALQAMKVGSYDGSSCIPVVSRRLMVTKHDQSSIQKYTRLVTFGKQVALVNFLLLCGDIALNPGPVTSKLVCPVCSKTIRKNQGRLNCVACKVWHHLKCASEDSKSTRICRLCTVPSPSAPALNESANEIFLDEALAVGSLQGNLKDLVCTRGLKIFHLNVRSLNGKIDELSILSTLSSGIHLLTLSETWLSSDIVDSEIDIVGYKLYRTDRKIRGGGVAVYVRDDICTIRRVDLESPDVESVWLQVNLPKSHAFLVGTFYRPPNSSKSYDTDFAIKLDSIIDSALAQTQSSEIILLGDFNCDFIAKRSPCNVTKQLKSLFKSYNFSQLIESPTRTVPGSSTLLDLIVTNCPSVISSCGVLSSGLSDHDMIYCVRKLHCKKLPAEIKTFRNYAKYEQNKFCEELKRVDWQIECDALGNQTESVHYVDQLWTSFKHLFIAVADNHAPLMSKKTRGKQTPWMSGQIKKVMYQRDNQLKKAKLSNRDEDWKLYRSLRNQVTAQIRKAKCNYNKKLIQDNSDNPKTFWKTINKILPNEKKKRVPSAINIDGNLITDRNMIANAFNLYFIGSVARLTAFLGFPNKNQGTYISSDYLIKLSKNSFRFTSVSTNFTIEFLRKLKVRKASGLDQIPARLMRDAAAEICNPLTKIINVSLETGYFPREWKVARVVPLFKSGKITDLDNYRPISILPVASKILERAVHTQLYKYLTACHYLSPYQCGFRKNHSTETAAIAFTDSVRRNMDQGLLTGSIFIDLRKAFDTIDQSVLLNKLMKYGVKDLELKWFNNYLLCRSQVVCLENVASEQCQVLSGVPQGSILGPLLFVLFINDLPSVFSKCQVLIYADDTVIYYASQTLAEIEQILTDELACLYQWLQKNNLFLNVKKTECLLFGTAPRLSKVNDFTITVGNSVLRRVVKFKYLGVIMDECLNWKAQTSAVFSKASKRIGMLRRIRNDITVNAADKVYKSFILPMLVP